MLVGRAAPPSWVQVDAGDDAAVVHESVTVTVDALVEGVHFDARLGPADVGYKSVAVSVSDIAAMGAAPLWMVCALSLPRGVDPLPWAADFGRGLREACTEFGVYLVGGDVTGSPEGAPRTVANTVVGRLVATPMRRRGAQVGHTLWVTGTPGLAGAGWMLKDPPAAAIEALRRPCPPVGFALALAADNLASAAMDLSDGPAADLPRLAAASGVRIVLDPSRLPTPTSLARHAEWRRAQLLGGDDYQLLFTADTSHRGAILALADAHDVVATEVGQVEAGAGAALTDGHWPAEAFTHFAAGGGP